MTSMAHARPLTEDEHVTAARKRWARDYLILAADAHRNTAEKLAYFTQKAFEYGCTADEIADILAARA